MKRAMKLDPVTLAVMNNRLAAIAEEMGVVLGQTGFSPNIKERHDFSCALFDGGGELVAQAAHIPVHLGSTPLSVRAAIERLELGPGDVAAVNDPFAGGTHLPDLTLVAPIFLGNERRPFAFAANRAHHADIGGMAPGSMALSTEIYQEGFRLPPVHIMRGGASRRATCWSCSSPTRECARSARATCARKSRRSIVGAAAAARAGGERAGERRSAAAMAALKDYADRLMRATLRRLRPGRVPRGRLPRRRRRRHRTDRNPRCDSDRRRTRDRRFHRFRAAGARLGQRQLCDHAVGDLLRDEVPGARKRCRPTRA